MSRVTSKLQLTLPRAIADRHGIRAGDEVAWVDAGESIRLVHGRRPDRTGLSVAERLALFDGAMRRADRRAARLRGDRGASGRGWTRADLYEERLGRARAD